MSQYAYLFNEKDTLFAALKDTLFAANQTPLYVWLFHLEIFTAWT